MADGCDATQLRPAAATRDAGTPAAAPLDGKRKAVPRGADTPPCAITCPQPVEASATMSNVQYYGPTAALQLPDKELALQRDHAKHAYRGKSSQLAVSHLPGQQSHSTPARKQLMPHTAQRRSAESVLSHPMPPSICLECTKPVHTAHAMSDASSLC